jgi:hypothetical protein
MGDAGSFSPLSLRSATIVDAFAELLATTSDRCPPTRATTAQSPTIA